MLARAIGSARSLTMIFDTKSYPYILFIKNKILLGIDLSHQKDIFFRHYDESLFQSRISILQEISVPITFKINSRMAKKSKRGTKKAGNILMQ